MGLEALGLQSDPPAVVPEVDVPVVGPASGPLPDGDRALGDDTAQTATEDDRAQGRLQRVRRGGMGVGRLRALSAIASASANGNVVAQSRTVSIGGVHSSRP